MAGEVTGASIPDGIDVDDAAAYFGVIESSDIVHSMMSMERAEAFEKFFSLLGDVVLKPGEFDFELASQSLNCEGGEIYYLVAGHLGIMSMADNLCDYLGSQTQWVIQNPVVRIFQMTKLSHYHHYVIR